MTQADTSGSAAKTVLLCEDEYIVAMDLQLILEDFGYKVVGPFAKVSAGLDAVQDFSPDVAFLDVNLRDGQVFPLADVLKERGVHLVFHSGHMDDSEIVNRYPGAMTCPKPVDTTRLEAALIAPDTASG